MFFLLLLSTGQSKIRMTSVERTWRNDGERFDTLRDGKVFENSSKYGHRVQIGLIIMVSISFHFGLRLTTDKKARKHCFTIYLLESTYMYFVVSSYKSQIVSKELPGEFPLENLILYSTTILFLFLTSDIHNTRRMHVFSNDRPGAIDKNKTDSHR